MPFYDNFLLLGDFNAEVSEPIMEEFCALYNLKNLMKTPTCLIGLSTCFKNPRNPSSIDVILTNCFRKLSEDLFFKKQSPSTIRYRDYKNFDLEIFRAELVASLNTFNGREMSYENVWRNLSYR